MKDLFTQANKEKYDIWDKLNKTSLRNLSGYYDPKANDGKGATIRGHNDYGKFLLELEQLDFLQKIFITRYNLMEGTEEEKLNFALEGEVPNPYDLGTK